METTTQPQSPADLDLLLEEVRTSPFIGQLTQQEIQTRIKDQTIRFFYENGDLVGFGAWDDIDKHWREIGPFYTLIKYRGKGLGTQIVEILVNLNAGKKLYAVTKNPTVKKLLVRLGFQPVTVTALPWAIYRHLISRLSPGRLFHLVTKFSLDPVAQYVRT